MVKARARKTDKAEIWKECGNTGTSGSCGQYLGGATCVYPMTYSPTPGHESQGGSCAQGPQTQRTMLAAVLRARWETVQLGWGSVTGRARTYNMVMLAKKSTS